MLKRILLIICAISLMISVAGCNTPKKKVKIGVSLGVGSAVRWEKEKLYMEEHAKELGAEIEVRLNKTDKPKTQQEDCFEMIDKGIDVLIITPRDANNVCDIIDYAKSKKVKVLSYARVMFEKNVDLFVGYDSARLGQDMGKYLAEMVYKGDYILLKGDQADHNAILLYDGAMRYIEPIKKDINVILDAPVDNWSPDNAKAMVKKAVQANGNKVDAILAPNDKIAAACVETLAELGVEKHVFITGMDAELPAIKRIVAGKQDMTISLDLREMSYAAIDESNNMATNKPVESNAKFDNKTPTGIDARLIEGKVITKQNIEKTVIASGLFTTEQVYGNK